MDNNTGLRFFFEINEAEDLGDGEKGSVTVYVVHGTNCARTNRRKLRAFLSAIGEPVWNHKRILKEMGFVGEALGL